MNSIQYLLFDLDDTLYTNTSGLFKEVGARIQAWVARTLHLSSDEAKALRHEYYLAYGTTMAGLIRHHPEVDVDDYLDNVHRIDVARYLAPSPELGTMMASLPVPKVVFTNAVMDWAERVLIQLGIRQHFESIIDVRATGYIGKPALQAYQLALKMLDCPGSACVFLEDQARNCKQGAAVGMRTILVRPGGVPEDGVDFAVDHILQAQPILERLLRDSYGSAL